MILSLHQNIKTSQLIDLGDWVEKSSECLIFELSFDFNVFSNSVSEDFLLINSESNELVIFVEFEFLYNFQRLGFFSQIFVFGIQVDLLGHKEI